MSETHALAERYRSAVEAGDLAALAKLYQPDALFDAHVPNWRFQVQGRDAIVEHTGGALPGPGRFASFDVEPTASGDLLVQFEWRGQTDGGEAVVRELHVLRLDEGRIAEQVMFCAGIWSPQLQAQMAGEAPLIRP
jgi:ketosteroid isomerase-like protein